MQTKQFPVTKYKVTKEYDDVRLDNCLISRIKGLPRTKIYSIIRKGEVRVNGSRSKPSTRLREGDEIRIPPYSLEITKKGKLKDNARKLIERSIVFKNENLIVINKPIGMASHGGSGISLGLIESLRQIDVKFKNAQLVHRLDKETSGCIVVALKRSTLRSMHKELREGRVEKHYLALVKGKWPLDLTSIELELIKNSQRSGEREVKVKKGGKKSLSYFELVKYKKNLSLIKCKIITGRTHQIRVQTTHLGHPIAGDQKYGDKEFNKALKKRGLRRMCLHSQSINFPSLKLKFKVDEPMLFQQLLT